MRLQSLSSISRPLFGILLLCFGIIRLFQDTSSSQALAVSLFDGIGLITLGIAFLSLQKLKLTCTLLFISWAIVFASLMDLRIISPTLLFFIATIVVPFLVFPKRARGRIENQKEIPRRLIAEDSSFSSYLSNRAYLERNATRTKTTTIVGNDPCTGARWQWGPVCFEHYVCDQEPVIENDGPKRMIIWQPLRKSIVPNGWRQTRFLWLNRRRGFTEIPKDHPYENDWSVHAMRHLKRWREASEWEIVEISPSDFIRAYKRSRQSPILKRFFISSIASRVKTQGENVKLFGGRRRSECPSPIEAGLAVLAVPEAEQSEHIISFLLPSAKDAPVGVGLIDHWFQESLKAGIPFLDFGVFWAPGDPEAWKGFSRFKSQFNITYIDFPKPRIRFVGSWRALLHRPKPRTLL